MADEDKVASIDIHKKVLMVVVGSREGEAIGRQTCAVYRLGCGSGR